MQVGLVSEDGEGHGMHPRVQKLAFKRTEAVTFILIGCKEDERAMIYKNNGNYQSLHS